MAATISYARQTGFFDPRQNADLQVHVFGAGSVGSFCTLALAKLGVQNITAYDFDKVEEQNVPNQFFKVSQIGEEKVVSLMNNVEDFTGVQIYIESDKITEETTLVLPINAVAIFCFDNMEARKLVFNKLKEQEITLIDVRAGGQGYSIQVVNLANAGECGLYEGTLEGVFSVAECGLQSVIYNIMSIAAEVCNVVKRIACKEAYTEIFKREMSTTLILAKVKK